MITIDRTLANGINFKNGYLDCETFEFQKNVNSCDQLSTNYEYKQLAEDDPNVVELNKILSQIFVDHELYQFAIAYAVSIFRIKRPVKRCTFMHGNGANGKSTWLALLQHTFGTYINVVPAGIVCEKNEIDSDTEEDLDEENKANVDTKLNLDKVKDDAKECSDIELDTKRQHNTTDFKDRRLIVVQESSLDENISLGHIKSLSGLDKLTVFCKPNGITNIDASWELAFICNVFPICAI